MICDFFKWCEMTRIIEELADTAVEKETALGYLMREAYMDIRYCRTDPNAAFWNHNWNIRVITYEDLQ